MNDGFFDLYQIYEEHKLLKEICQETPIQMKKIV